MKYIVKYIVNYWSVCLHHHIHSKTKVLYSEQGLVARGGFVAGGFVCTLRATPTFPQQSGIPCLFTPVNQLITYLLSADNRSSGLTENDGHENDGPNLRRIKLQNLTTLNTLSLEIHAVTLKWHCFYAFVCDFYTSYV